MSIEHQEIIKPIVAENPVEILSSHVELMRTLPVIPYVDSRIGSLIFYGEAPLSGEHITMNGYEDDTLVALSERKRFLQTMQRLLFQNEVAQYSIVDVYSDLYPWDTGSFEGMIAMTEVSRINAALKYLQERGGSWRIEGKLIIPEINMPPRYGGGRLQK